MFNFSNCFSFAVHSNTFSSVLFISPAKEKHESVNIKTRKKLVSIILISALLLIGTFLFIKYNGLGCFSNESNIIVDETESEAISWEFDIDELTEEEYELFIELKDQGISFIERIRIIKPDKYEELMENPFMYKMITESNDFDGVQ